MNIVDLFQDAGFYLKRSREKFEADDYDGSLAAIVKLYELNRALLVQVGEVAILHGSEQRPAGEKP